MRRNFAQEMIAGEVKELQIGGWKGGDQTHKRIGRNIQEIQVGAGRNCSRDVAGELVARDIKMLERRAIS